MADEVSVGSIVAMLQNLPSDLVKSDIAIAMLERQIDEAKESLEIAETNASLNAIADGKNKEARDLQYAQAKLNDPQAKIAKTNLLNLQATLEEKRAENKSLARQFAAYCHIAELKAAQMNLMSKGQSQ